MELGSRRGLEEGGEHRATCKISHIAHSVGIRLLEPWGAVGCRSSGERPAAREPPARYLLGLEVPGIQAARRWEAPPDTRGRHRAGVERDILGTQASHPLVAARTLSREWGTGGLARPDSSTHPHPSWYGSGSPLPRDELAAAPATAKLEVNIAQHTIASAPLLRAWRPWPLVSYQSARLACAHPHTGNDVGIELREGRSDANTPHSEEFCHGTSRR